MCSINTLAKVEITSWDQRIEGANALPRDHGFHGQETQPRKPSHGEVSARDWSFGIDQEHEWVDPVDVRIHQNVLQI